LVPVPAFVATAVAAGTLDHGIAGAAVCLLECDLQSPRRGADTVGKTACEDELSAGSQ